MTCRRWYALLAPDSEYRLLTRQGSDFDSITLRAESGDTTATALQDVYPMVRRKAVRLHLPHCQAFPFFLGGLSGAPSEVDMHSRNAGGVTLWTHNAYNKWAQVDHPCRTMGRVLINEIGKRQ
jgi:hypothetical protein